MKLAIILCVALVVYINDVYGTACRRTNKKAGNECVDECQLSVGCSDDKKQCVCDADCGYSCVKKGLQCKALKNLRHGRVIGNDRTFNSTLRFQCDPNYTLFGSSTRRCNAKGFWGGRKARCKIACPDPGVPAFANRIRDKSAVGFSERTTLHYTCFPGYTTTHVLKITCQKNRQWSSAPPVCKVQQCGRLKLPANSYVRLPQKFKYKSSYQLGTKLYLSCKPGYRSSAIFGRMQCRLSGWSVQKSFNCRAKSCGDPGTPRNGKKIGLSYMFNDVVHYSCNHCFKLSGVIYRQCLADATWSDSLPSCTRVTCSNPGEIDHGTVSLSSQPIYCASHAQYTCSTGYRLKGKDQIVCLADGSWSDNSPKCEIVNCGDPGHPKNGITTANSGFTYGNEVTFKCDPNFVLDGSLLATCESNGKWSKNPPKCLEKCSDPSDSTNARVRGSEFYHGKEVEFVCPRDSVVVPSQFRKLTCNDGRWLGTIPTCKASCPRFPRLSDGSRRGSSRLHGAIVRFSCFRGHKLVGVSQTKCDDGVWSSAMPRCLAICNPIQSITNGWINGGNYLEGDILTFRCRQNYVLEGEKVLTCTGKRRWNASKPTCNAPCSKLDAPVDGKISQQGFRHNENVKFECDDDYYLEGRNILTCSNGKWNAKPPRCFAPCAKFDDKPFPGGYIIKHGFRHNEEVKFGCRGADLVIDGQTTRRCDDGTWLGNLPKCGGPCRKFASPKNGYILKNGYKHGETVKFACKFGFQLLGLAERHCNFGAWSDFKLPRCVAKCRQIWRFKNGRVNGNGRLEGSVLSFTCDPGYILQGEKVMRCTSTGVWNASQPNCQAVVASTTPPTSSSTTTKATQVHLKNCSDVAKIRKGKVEGSGVGPGSKRTFSCSKGWELSGARTIVCLNNSEWSAPQPTCKLKGAAIPCKIVKPIVGGVAVKNESFHGGRVVFRCYPKYVMSGKPGALCKSGNWNRVPPKCHAPCPSLGSPLHGSIKAQTGRLHENSITFACNSGYLLNGSATLKCNDGKWSHPQPTCEK